MRKSILLLSSVGIGAGLVYALEANLRNQKKARTAASNESEEAEHSSTASQNGDRRAAKVKPKRTASMARVENGHAAVSENNTEPQIDDLGTDQAEASQILRNIRDTAFDASDEKLALALGRPTEEISEWTSGTGLIDGDVVMKARALAIQRHLEVE